MLRKNASKKDWFPNDIAVVVCTCHTKFLQIQTDCYTQSNIFRVPVCKFPRFSAIKLNGNQSLKKSQVHHTIVISCKNVFAFWRQIWITRYFSLNFQQHFLTRKNIQNEKSRLISPSKQSQGHVKQAGD